MTDAAHSAIAKARDEFLALAEHVRPELHRYCARLTGSVIEGEDIVQETLARAFYAFAEMAEPPPLRPWLFRIAHNAAIDHLRRHETKLTEARDDAVDLATADAPADPAIVRAALARFLSLPTTQRCAVILKDVLDHSLEETAATMETTVMAVKAALVRGRAALRVAPAENERLDEATRRDLDRYASCFNRKDWDGVRALVSGDCRLDLVSKSQRRGKQVGSYFGNYEKLALSVRVGHLEGRLALAVYEREAAAPSYFILLEWEDGKVVAIRDFRYVPYISAEAEFVLLE